MEKSMKRILPSPITAGILVSASRPGQLPVVHRPETPDWRTLKAGGRAEPSNTRRDGSTKAKLEAEGHVIVTRRKEKYPLLR
ncbi:MAG: hypothetical protein ACLU3I_09580 [Acutalibacteraceae bacterium]